MELNDKVAVITGGSGGIGQAMAKAFLAQGARAVVIADLDEANVQTATAEIGCDGLACDVTDEAEVRRLVDFALDKYGQVDLYCSNAGSATMRAPADAATSNSRSASNLSGIFGIRRKPPCAARSGRRSST